MDSRPDLFREECGGVLLQLESSSNLLKMTVVLAPLELIHLVGQPGQAAGSDPAKSSSGGHALLVCGGHLRSARHLEEWSALKIGFNRFLPATTHCFRHLRVAITRQIDQMKQLIDRKN